MSVFPQPPASPHPAVAPLLSSPHTHLSTRECFLTCLYPASRYSPYLNTSILPTPSPQALLSFVLLHLSEFPNLRVSSHIFLFPCTMPLICARTTKSTFPCTCLSYHMPPSLPFPPSVLYDVVFPHVPLCPHSPAVYCCASRVDLPGFVS